jgi:hypothetical protein
MKTKSYKRMKILFLSIVFVFFAGITTGYSQSFKWKVEASTVLKPEQMRKDIDYFFETLAKVHVNMYAFTSREEIDRVKEQLYRNCSEPMTAYYFNMHLLRHTTNLFDGHTYISWYFGREANQETGFFPLPVDFRNGKIYLLENDDLQGKRIFSINGVPATDLYKQFVNTNEINEAGEVGIGTRFAYDLFTHTGIRSPYEVVTEENNRQYVIRLNGVGINDVKQKRSGYSNQKPLGFRIYPEKSIAVIDYNTCVFGRDSAAQKQLNDWFDETFNQIITGKIKHLFIDISRNGGGNSTNNDVIFKHIRHRDTIRLTYEVQRRYLPYDDGGKELGYLKTDTFNNVTPPNKTGFAGSIYLIQGPGSYSAALGVAEWFNALDNAKLIGGQTGQATAIYIDISLFTMPESQIRFGCSHKYARSLPESHEDKGVQPDYPVKLDYTKEYYELNDLLEFMTQIRQ